ncbi:hypothetical protein IF129_23030 [Streptomyces chumphonensis]|uniref:Uncharacterized protein n=1 Tax=Streptomyces chumphonensis TaxID=1214925 RepID=A0A927IF61_9ACTN|nr:hypothetical protein [Streptomyces chumphonensis]MBD3934424.1 hypothetical protein [Streptomyces chumphonensis]
MSNSGKKGGVLGRLFGSDKSDSDCCSVQIVEETDEPQEKNAAPNGEAEAPCCGTESQRDASAEEARR